MSKEALFAGCVLAEPERAELLDVETRFLARAARGSVKTGLAMLRKLDEGAAQKRADYRIARRRAR